MKVTTPFFVCKLSLLTILFFAVACQKGDHRPDGLSDEVYTVRFEIKDFESFTRPVGQQAYMQRNQSNKIASGEGGTSAQLYEGYLYYWSFNDESLIPDIAIHSGSRIRYNGGQIPNNFAAGWVYDGYQAGRALNLSGVQELTICFLIERAVSLSTLGFDIGSSATGPKAFDLYRSIDGESWEEQQLDNQFGNTNTAQARNAFTFDDMGQIGVEELDSLWFRIIPKAGERGTANAYNPTSGVVRIDNIRLNGTAISAENSSTDKLHYYVFDANTGNLVADDVFEFDAANSGVSMDLPYGNYEVSFVRNSSHAELMMPAAAVNLSDYYFSNRFSNHLASIFAQEKTVFVNQDLNHEITLDRYYSQVKFEFTDSRDLSIVKRLVISQLHEPFFYTPFNPTLNPALVDQSEIDVEPDFSLSKEFVFHQFMGKVSTAQPISYRVEAYGENNVLLRMFAVSTAIRHNVQLVFRGELLGGVSFSSGFYIQINEEWEDEIEVSF